MPSDGRLVRLFSHSRLKEEQKKVFNETQREAVNALSAQIEKAAAADKKKLESNLEALKSLTSEYEVQNIDKLSSCRLRFVFLSYSK